MPAKIAVEQIDKFKFRVRVSELGSETVHEVTVSSVDHARLAGDKIQPEELVRRSFEFLLERESKDSILARFDLSVISRYFPEYEREIKRRLSQEQI
jgi:uncharacterized protein YlxP (DUF503 family)